MSTLISFFKYSATGNDFILIDNRNRQFTGTEAALFERLCARKTGIGADGILLIETSTPRFSFRMRYFNRDGRESEMCGNGARAAAYHAANHEIAGASMTFEVSGGAYQADVTAAFVRLVMPRPTGLRLDLSVWETAFPALADRCQDGGFVNTGVPHYVLFASKLGNIPVNQWGSALRRHVAFAPAGTNVNFATRVDATTLRLRTYERGVEEETLACGTGAVATAVLAIARKIVDRFPVRLLVPGGELEVDIEQSTGHPILTGEVSLTFRGEFVRPN